MGDEAPALLVSRLTPEATEDGCVESEWSGGGRDRGNCGRRKGFDVASYLLELGCVDLSSARPAL